MTYYHRLAFPNQISYRRQKKKENNKKILIRCQCSWLPTDNSLLNLQHSHLSTQVIASISLPTNFRKIRRYRYTWKKSIKWPVDMQWSKVAVVTDLWHQFLITIFSCSFLCEVVYCHFFIGYYEKPYECTVVLNAGTCPWTYQRFLAENNQ